MKLLINEIFESIQGEGRMVGKPATFVRLQGCNLNCDFCDSKHSWGTDAWREEVPYLLAREIKLNHIVITGGEPMMQERELYDFIECLREDGCTVEVETNGLIFPEDNRINGLKVQYNVSPKMDFMYIPEYKLMLSKWNGLCDFKFVIRNEQEFLNVMELVRDLQLHNIIVMPEGVESNKMIEDTRLLVEWVMNFGLNWRVIPRVHTLLYGNERRK